MSFYPLIAVELLIVTAIPTLVLCWRYRSKGTQSFRSPFGLGGFIAMALVMLFGLATDIVVPVLFPIVLAAVAFVCSARNVAYRSAIGWIVSVALLLDLGFLGWWGSVVWGLDDQLRKHPVVSLVDRLDYERGVRTITDFQPLQHAAYHRFNEMDVDETESKLPNAVHFNAENLKRLEHEISLEGRHGNGRERIWMLRSLLQAHYDTSIQFSQALGQGVGRAQELPYKSWRLELPEPSAILIPTNEISVLASFEDNNSPSIGIDFEPWHEKNLVNFANPAAMGLVDWDWRAKRPDLSRVVGFRSHAFRSLPESPIRSGTANMVWRIDALMLMSLLKQPQPAIYVTKYLPDMQALANVATRPLDSFESASLEELKKGEELVVRGGETEIHMVGAIRAATQCIECHQVSRGTLLGAFVYRLAHVEAPSQPISHDCF